MISCSLAFSFWTMNRGFRYNPGLMRYRASVGARILKRLVDVVTRARRPEMIPPTGSTVIRNTVFHSLLTTTCSPIYPTPYLQLSTPMSCLCPVSRLVGTNWRFDSSQSPWANVLEGNINTYLGGVCTDTLVEANINLDTFRESAAGIKGLADVVRNFGPKGQGGNGTE